MPDLQSLILNQAIPSVFDAAASLLLVIIIFYLFKVTNPATRFALVSIAMLRAFIVLIDNASLTMKFKETPAVIQYGFRLLDPFNLISLHDRTLHHLAYSTSAFTLAITLILYGIAAFIVLRWIQLFSFLSQLKNETELDRTEFAWLYDLVDEIALSTNVKRPRLVLTNRFPIVPFSIGLMKPTIVLSYDLIEKFQKEQLVIMLAHEMAHIRRKDYLNNWFTMILRDVMFFNPVTHMIYRLIEEEKEKICDRKALHLIKTTPSKIAATLVDVALFYKATQLKSVPVSPSLTRGFLYRRSALERRISSISIATDEKPKGRIPSFLKLSGKYFIFILVLLVQVTIILDIGGQIIMLR